MKNKKKKKDEKKVEVDLCQSVETEKAHGKEQ